VIRRALRAAAAAEGVPAGAGVSVLVCGDGEIRRLNRDFAGEDHATDVLSFATREPGAPPLAMPPGSELELGDIVLSLDHLGRQAAAAGHGLDVEAATLAIHGFLHLLGHDHADPASERAMFGRTAEILGTIGLDPRAAHRAGRHLDPAVPATGDQS